MGKQIIFKKKTMKTNHGSSQEKVLQLFGRKKGNHLFLTSSIIAVMLKRGKDAVTSITSKLIAQNKIFKTTNLAGQNIYACRAEKKLKYSSWELIANISEKHFNRIGALLTEKLRNKEKIVLKIKELTIFEKEFEMPDLFIFYFIKCFIDCGLLKLKEGEVVTFESKTKNLTAGEIRNTAFAKKAMEIVESSDFQTPQKNNLISLRQKMKNHNDDAKITVIPIEVENLFAIQHVCEILFGHQDLDVGELERIVTHLETMQSKERPDLVVISGLIQGAFQHVQKRRRNTLVKGLKSDGAQLAYAMDFMKRIAAIGLRIVVNKTDDDALWAENTTVFMCQSVQSSARSDTSFTRDKDKKFINYYGIDKLKGSKIWDTFYSFVWQVALEYQIRCGRRLYSAEEVFEKTSGSLKSEESLLLFNVYNLLRKGEPVPEEYKKIVEVENIPYKGKTFTDFTVVDDCVFDVTIKNSKKGEKTNFSIMEKHFFRLTPNSMVGDPTKSIREITQLLESMGKKKPNIVFIEHEQQSFLFFNDTTLVVSLPGMQTHDIYRRSLNSNVQGDPAHRILTTRREASVAGTMPFTIFSDGSFEVFFNFGHYMEKASISPDRIAIPFCFDWQTGSVTATSDLQAKWMDYIFHRILPNYATYLFFGGDHIQGYNYPQHVIENMGVGLIGIDNQKQFVKFLIQNAALYVEKKYWLESLKLVGIVPGNHEWNPGNRLGLSHVDMIENAFREIFIHYGIFVPTAPNQREVVPTIKAYDQAMDTSGNTYKVPAGHENIGGYEVRMQHLIIEKMKGGVTGTPVTALKSQLVGNTSSFSGVDFLATGHWHSPQMLKLGHTTGFISGSLASTSGYEYLRALHATIGACILYVGGGKPPSLRFFNMESLLRYEPIGFYSKKNLALVGYRDDKDFDPFKHRFNRIVGKPQSAIQKFLLASIDGLNHPDGNMFGRR